MSQKKINTRAYEQASFPPKPGAVTKFFRTCVIYQFIRFLSINVKMLQVVAKSH